MNVAIYIRVSTQDQSSDLQRTELLRYAKARGWTVHKVYADKASGASDSRPGINALMKAAMAREVDIVLVWKLDRFARSLKNLLTAIQDLQAVGVTFVSFKDQIDLSTPSGRLMAQMIGAFAEFERSLIVDRVRAGLVEARRKGVRLGRPTEIDRGKVQALKARGYSYARIAQELGCSKAGVFKVLKASG